MNSISLFSFQEDAVAALLNFTFNQNSKQTIVLKAPTGSGKTIILIDFIDEYLSKIDSNVSFIWLCPGRGNLEEQSMEKMMKYAPHRRTQNLFDALQDGFSSGVTTFINWELVTKKGNNALKDGERKNIYERIADAHRDNIKFIIIIDEEHSNNTDKANDIMSAFSAKNIIRASATAKFNSLSEYYEIDERDVITTGLITKAISVNEGIVDGVLIENEIKTLLDIADSKRKDIAKRYADLQKDIRPLVLIQFPNAEPETVELVEKQLDSMGYSYNNGMVSKWMSDDKRDLQDNLTDNNGTPVYLLMKQAISTGWDCPRAKILIKLREGMNKDFEIQTVGRIRRMPEARHYDDELLDYCYVYTFDEEWKYSLFVSIEKSYETRRLFLKEKCKTFSIQKQLRNKDYDGLGDRDILTLIKNSFVERYHLSKNMDDNKRLLGDVFKFGNLIDGTILQGIFVTTQALENTDHIIKTSRVANSHNDGIYLLHSVDELKHIIGLNSERVRNILERLFRKTSNLSSNIVALDTSEFYAFIINNKDKLKEEFKIIAAGLSKQTALYLDPKEVPFKIPLEDFFKYDPTVKNEKEIISNAYEKYSSGCVTHKVRSMSEILFEKYCESRDDIDWVYKNGDSGQKYFSITYLDGLLNQWLFYADYIVMKKDGTIWIIETKGGENNKGNKNIDIQIENKFNAFKIFAAEHNLHWGFVRDKDAELYINNTEFDIDMSNNSVWRELSEVF